MPDSFVSMGRYGPVIGAGRVCIHDEELRPIRDQPGEDEILRVAGKPRREENVNFPPNVFTISID